MTRQASRPTGLPILYDCAAGIDIGSRFHVVAVPRELCEVPIRTFQGFTGDLEQMADWLVSIGIRTVAMESTGVYWVPVYEVLRDRGVDVIVALWRTPAKLVWCLVEKAMSTMRSGCSACMPVACCVRAFGPIARSQRCGAICDCVNAISITLQPTSSTCKRHLL